MNALGLLIRDEIRAHGPMRFDRFMGLALYHPQHGYYARPRRIGRTGDFFTSVSVGPLFGRLLARQFRQMAELLGEDEFWIIEQGAHDGQLASDILREWENLPNIPGRLHYLSVEPSSAAQEIQARSLQPWLGQVEWLKRIEDWKDKAPAGVFFSNELVDAFPVRAIEFTDAWRERCATEEGEGLGYVSTAIADDELSEALRDPVLPRLENYRTEIHLEARRWMRGAAGFLRRGYMLTFDYGYPASLYYAPFRREGTLTSYRAHSHSRDVLSDPGERDLTAHVEFTSLARVGREEGWTPLGLVDQERFLTGIVERETEAIRPDDMRAFQTLTHPEHLGSRFKALVQVRDAPHGLAGLRFARSGQLD